MSLDGHFAFRPLQSMCHDSEF